MGFLKYPGNTKIQKHGQTGYKKSHTFEVWLFHI